MPRTSSLVCVGLLLWPASGLAQKTPSNAAATIVSTSARSMFVVARMLVEDTWNPLLDKRIQASPSARSLGAAWKPSDPRWQKARAALGARATRIFDAYAKSSEIADHVQAEVGRIGASKDLDAAVALLTGPAAGAIVRQQAQKTYIVHAMTAGGPNVKGPAIGSPEWSAELRDMGKRFDERAGTDVPADDGTHKAEVEKMFSSAPVSEVLRRVWDFGVDNATRQLNTALNLMVFDNQDAIEKDIAAAAGRAGGAPAPAAAGFPLEQMATCKDSWLEWGADEARVGAYRESFLAQFRQKKGDAFFVPVTSVSVMGLKVLRVYSNTIGMARGFSLLVDAPFDTAKKSVEKSLRTPLEHCETSDGMRTCDLEIAEKKTVTLMADATGKEKSTLVGCFYFYEK